MAFPSRIETPRLIVRRYQPEDAALLKAAIDQSLDRLQPWMPWAREEPTPLPELAARLATFADRFDAGLEWVVGIFDRQEQTLLGGAGLHRRGPEHVLEIGYWIRTGAEGHGYVSEAIEALRRVAGRVSGVTHLRICCDPQNERSAAIPQRLGFVSLGVAPNDGAEAEGDRDYTATWEWTIPKDDDSAS